MRCYLECFVVVHTTARVCRWSVQRLEGATVRHTSTRASNGLRQTVLVSNFIVIRKRPFDILEQTSVKSNKKNSFKKIHLTMTFVNTRPFCPGLCTQKSDISFCVPVSEVFFVQSAHWHVNIVKYIFYFFVCNCIRIWTCYFICQQME